MGFWCSQTLRESGARIARNQAFLGALGGSSLEKQFADTDTELLDVRCDARAVSNDIEAKRYDQEHHHRSDSNTQPHGIS